MKIYKNVPEQFHSQFMDTINTIEEEQEKNYRGYGRKKMILLTAVLVLALSTITVSVAYIFGWNQAAKDRLGAEEVAEQMNQEGIAKQEYAVVSGEGVEINAIQSVMTDEYCYVLLSVSAPEQVPIDDVLFRETYVESDVGIERCVVNPALYNIEGNGHLWEALLYIDDAVDYSGADVVIVLNDLQRVDLKAEIDETIVEGEWRIPFTLPSESEILKINQERTMQIGHHEVLKIIVQFSFERVTRVELFY